jgi:hypothetical protein
MKTDIPSIIAKLVEIHGPVINAETAARISNRKLQTIYDWSSRGLLNDCRSPLPGPILLSTEGFGRYLFERDEE